MPSSQNLYAPPSRPAPQRADPCADPAPPCPVCGGLKCLCRPRFFPGQLLSDEDLNRLQQYVIDKNRLHNRYLVGWGVACGLEVACSPCEADAVTVRAGYALAPCGDDIVVCADQTVNICELIQRCRPEPVECERPYGEQPTPCRAEVERWVLAVCYDERPARGIAALTGAGDSVARSGCRCGGSGGAGCSCGGSSAGGCGCGGCGCGGRGEAGCQCGANGNKSSSRNAGSTSSAYQPADGRRRLLPQCEPTQVCEGYRFTAWRAPAPAKGLAAMPETPAGRLPANDLLIAWLYANRARFGPLLERVLCCVLRALDLRAAIREGTAPDAAGAVIVYRDYAQALQEFAAEFALHHCAFVDETRQQVDGALAWARPRIAGQLSPADRNELTQRTRALDELWIRIATECFCSALLPACPPPGLTNCVPLAVVTVRNGEHCQVLDICNWQERKLLVTWPTVMYWLSWLPWERLREWMARICCGSDQRDTAYQLMTMMLGMAVDGARRAAPAPSPSPAGLRPRAAGAAPPPPPPPGAPAAGPGGFDRAMDADNLVLHMLGEYEAARGGAESQPAWAALAARMVDGSAFAPMAGQGALHEADLRDVEKRLGVAALREQIASLQRTVERQENVLKALQVVNRQGGNG